MAKNIQSHRISAFHRQQGLCFYCDKLMWEATYCQSNPGRRHLQCTAEHLIPRSEGGANIAENVVAACWYCNSRRHRSRLVLSPIEYRDKVQGRILEGRWNN